MITPLKLVSSSAIFLLFLLKAASAQNVGINATGATPDASAGLDVNFTNKGLLIPRVALTSVAAAAPLTAPAVSLLVYNTATAGTAPNDVTPGYYYWAGTAWSRLAVSSAQATRWSITGNTGTNPAANFIGTTDAQDLSIRTNNTETMRVSSGGNVGIATATPAAKLDVGGNFKLGAAGSVLGGILKTSITINNVTNITSANTLVGDFTVTGATTNAAVIVNPRTNLPNALGIAWARVVSDGVVRIAFNNTSITNRTFGTIIFDITIIQ